MYISNKQQYSVRSENDMFICNVEGVCFLPDGSVVITDTENVVVKHLDSSFKVSSKHYPSSVPFGVCAIDDENVAVALKNKTIELLSVSKEIVNIRIITLDHRCYGIAYHKGQLFVTDSGDNFLSDGALYAYSLSGSKLQVFRKEPKGSDIFSRPCHLAVSPCGGHIYVADLDFGLVTVDMQANMSRFKPDGIVAAIGLCLPESGTLFVSGLHSHNVVQVDLARNKVVNDILPATAGLHEPIGLCVDMKMSKLIIAVKNSDVIGVYDLIH